MLQIACYTSTYLILAMASAHSTQLPVSQENEVPSYDFPFIPRAQWRARPATGAEPLTAPVPYVTIHHSFTPAACYNLEECSRAMRAMQDMHMDQNSWCDVGYSFAVGSDGAVYEGRGWERMGAHALHFNTVSIGICLIGDWTASKPPAVQLKAAKAVIAAGIELGYIKTDYRLVGHRQVRSTECPGEALYQEIKTWDHYSKFPVSVKDLLEIPEIPESTKALIRNRPLH